jgi:hypothetical protein
MKKPILLLVENFNCNSLHWFSACALLITGDASWK